ncbi:MBL fold metallo-hydrolase [Chlamydiota bacterium]
MIKKIVVGPIETNCYIINDDNKNSVVIDPGDQPEKINQYLDKNKLQVACIIQTHAHYDHIGATRIMQKKWDVPVYLRSEDVPMLNMDWSLWTGYPMDITPPKNPELLDEKTEIKIASMTFKIIHTPGHSPGGICLYCVNDNVLFSGDTLFCDGIGRTDLPNGSYEEMKKSLNKLFEIFPDDTRVLPGHGPETTIGRERHA